MLNGKKRGKYCNKENEFILSTKYTSETVRAFLFFRLISIHRLGRDKK